MVNFNSKLNIEDLYKSVYLGLKETELTDKEALNLLTTPNLSESDLIGNVGKIEQIATASITLQRAIPGFEVEQKAFSNNAWPLSPLINKNLPIHNLTSAVPSTPKKISHRKTAIVKTLPITPASKQPISKTVKASASNLRPAPKKLIEKKPKASVQSTAEIKKKKGRPRTASLTTQLASSKFRAIASMPANVPSEYHEKSTTPSASVNVAPPPAISNQNSMPALPLHVLSQTATSTPQLQMPAPPPGYAFVPLIPVFLCRMALPQPATVESPAQAVKPLVGTNPPAAKGRGRSKITVYQPKFLPTEKTPKPCKKYQAKFKIDSKA